MQNFENLEVFEILITQKLLKCPKDPFLKFILLKPNGKCADQAGCKKAHSGQYLCCSHATTSFLLMTKILYVAGRRVHFGD